VYFVSFVVPAFCVNGYLCNFVNKLRFRRIPLSDGIRRCMASAVRNSDVQLLDSQLFGDVARSRVESDRRGAARLVADFDVAPADAPFPAGAEDFEDGFFGCPATGVVLGGGFFGGTIANFVFGVDAADEQLAVTLDHLRDPQAFDDVGADT